MAEYEYTHPFLLLSTVSFYPFFSFPFSTREYYYKRKVSFLDKATTRQGVNDGGEDLGRICQDEIFNFKNFRSHFRLFVVFLINPKKENKGNKKLTQRRTTKYIDL